MDDDGLVEDVVDNNMQTDSNQASSFVFNFISQSFSFIESNGWFLLIVALIVYYLYNTFRKSASDSSRISKKQDDHETVIRNIEKIEEARMRQQAAFEAAKQKYLEEQKLKEQKAAEEKAKEWERHREGLGYKSKIKKTVADQEEELAKLGLSSANKTNPKPKLRPSDYNPLTGSSSSASGDACYRPSKRGGGAGRGG